MVFAKQRQQDCRMGEQIDPLREMEASRMASMEPATRQANRGRAADAVGNAIAADALTRRAARR